MKLLISIVVTAIGAILVWLSGVADHIDALPVETSLLLLGFVLVAAGLVGVKLADNAYARQVIHDDSRETSADLWNGLLGSLRELFIGPKKQP